MGKRVHQKPATEEVADVMVPAHFVAPFRFVRAVYLPRYAILSGSLPPRGGGLGWGRSAARLHAPPCLYSSNYTTHLGHLRPPTLTLPHKGGGNQTRGCAICAAS